MEVGSSRKRKTPKAEVTNGMWQEWELRHRRGLSSYKVGPIGSLSDSVAHMSSAFYGVSSLPGEGASELLREFPVPTPPPPSVSSATSTLQRSQLRVRLTVR